MLSTVKNFDDRELKWKTSFVFVKIKDMCGLTKVQMLCSALYSKVQYSTVQYSTVQYSTVQYSTVQYSTVQYSTDFNHLYLI